MGVHVTNVIVGDAVVSKTDISDGSTIFFQIPYI